MDRDRDLMKELVWRTTTSCFKHVMFIFQVEKLRRVLGVGIKSLKKRSGLQIYI